MPLTTDDIEDILALLDGAPFGELHLQTASFALSLRRDGEGRWTQEQTVTRSPSVDPSLESAAAGAVAPAVVSVVSRDGEGSDGGVVVVASPQLGTFYRAPKPGAPPYVDVGSEVEPETVVGLIETMKLMNSVYAGCKGRVRDICVADAQFVEKGTPLMRLEPSA